MGKAFGLVLMLIAMYIGMTIYTEGIDGLLGGMLDPIESTERDSSFAGHLTAGAQDETAPTERSRRGSTLDRVHDRVSSDYAEGARRRGYDE